MTSLTQVPLEGVQLSLPVSPQEVVATSDVSGNFNAGDFCLGTELVFQRNGYVTRSVIVTSLTERIALSDISKD